MYAYNIDLIMEAYKVNQDKPRKIGAFEKRIHEIDFARGILIALVLMDHVFNLLLTFGNKWCGGPGIFAGGFFDWYWYGGYYTGPLGQVFHPYWTPRAFIYPIALAGFCLVSGISCAFTKNNWKRAIETLFVWAILFLGSNIIQLLSNLNGWGLQIAIDFNVIGVLGVSMLVYCLIQNRSNKMLIVMIIFGLLMALYIVPAIQNTIVDFNDPSTFFVENRMGKDVYAPRIYCPLLWLPHKYEGCKSGDFMPLFPYFSCFFVGVLLSRLLYKNRKSLLPKHEAERPICFIGRHTLIIYLTHIPVLYGVFYLIDLIVTACIGG